MRNKNIISILLISIFCTLIFIPYTIISSQDENKAYISSIKGEVEVGKIISPDREASDEIQIGEGWFVRTGKDSSAKLFVNELIVKIKENTRVEITKSTNETIRLNLKYGFINVDSRKLNDNKEIIVDTEDSVVKAEETSTVFELDFNDSIKDLDYNVKEGSISITNDNEKIFIDKDGIKNKESVTEKKEEPEEFIFDHQKPNNEIENQEDDIIEEIIEEPEIEDVIEPENEEIIEEPNIEEEFDVIEIPDIEIDETDMDEYNEEEIIEEPEIEGVIEPENEEIIKEPNIEEELDEIDTFENNVDNSPEEEETTDLPESPEDIVDKDVIDDIEDRGMVINEGIDPPNLEGKYYVVDWFLVYDNKVAPYYFDPGYQMKDYFYTFYDQTDNNRIKVKFNAVDNSQIFGVGNGAFISGSNNKFTVYFRTHSIINGDKLDTVQIVSGKVVENGIINFQLALIILGKIDGNVDNMQMQDFARIGTKRIFVAKSLALRIAN